MELWGQLGSENNAIFVINYFIEYLCFKMSLRPLQTVFTIFFYFPKNENYFYVLMTVFTIRLFH